MDEFDTGRGNERAFLTPSRTDPDDGLEISPSRGEYAGDCAILTSDNPRSEDPAAIIADMLTGVDRSDPTVDVVVELDRRGAIGRAVSEARPGDVILVAGRGHETVQVIGADELPFDDRVVAVEAIHALTNNGSDGFGE